MDIQQNPLLEGRLSIYKRYMVEGLTLRFGNISQKPAPKTKLRRYINTVPVNCQVLCTDRQERIMWINKRTTNSYAGTDLYKRVQASKNHYIPVPVIQNVADPRRNGRIGKVFALAEPRFRRDMERDFRI